MRHIEADKILLDFKDLVILKNELKMTLMKQDQKLYFLI